MSSLSQPSPLFTFCCFYWIFFRRKNFVTETDELFPPFWSVKFPVLVMSWTTTATMVALAVGVVAGIIFYRIALGIRT